MDFAPTAVKTMYFMFFLQHEIGEPFFIYEKDWYLNSNPSNKTIKNIWQKTKECIQIKDNYSNINAALHIYSANTTNM